MASRNAIFFNVQHAPIGAFASFTLGCKGARGGLGLEIGTPANESVFIGLEDRRPGSYSALPFYAGAEDEAKRYEVESAARGGGAPQTTVTPFRDAAIWRTLGLATDTWEAGDLTFTVHSPFRSAPDPDAAPPETLQLAYVPALVAELTVDNRRCARSRRAFFGYAGRDPYQKMRRLDDTTNGHLAGVGIGTRTAIVSADPSVRSGLGFSLTSILAPQEPENLAFALGDTGLLMADVPARKRVTYRFAICFFRGGVVTTGLPASYLYTRWFERIEDVASFATRHFDALAAQSTAAVRALRIARLSDDQRFQFVHAVHSYYGSTELLDAGRPFWIVNEGEYRMMNTFDLTADQVFFETLLNPWTVRNELEWFVSRYSYQDEVRAPGGQLQPGGISFTHDMGVANNLSRPGHSAYEQFGLDGCFSHMTHEELVNWVCCAAVYVARTDDVHWFKQHAKVFRACFESMCRRDNPDPARRTGVMGFDSSRCKGGAEITTYDSLDASLGQARNNLYLAVKCWAAYVCMAELFAAEGDATLASAMRDQARLTADNVIAHAGPDGLLPAVFDEGVESRIIPAVEGLVFPWFCGYGKLVSAKGPYGDLIAALKQHLAAALQPGICLFRDGGWKLSSTSDNSWLSKIYICQFVAREILGFAVDARSRRADAAHVAWLLHPDNTYWAWSDQIVAGIAKGSKYYPRGVTSILWSLE